jgi:hypothetical protein
MEVDTSTLKNTIRILYIPICVLQVLILNIFNASASQKQNAEIG